MARLRGAAWIGALALLLWLVWGHGFANYDALYSLIWGAELADGQAPSFGVELAPTPHPLSNLAGVVLSPLEPRTAEDVLVVLAFLALGAVGFLTYRLGALWFGVPAGLLAAVIILTREPVLSYGTRAYVDLPYLALVLAALLWVRRERAPFVALALAGLLRPEAWLFSFALLAWRWWRWGVRWDIAAIAAAGPVLWLLSDLIATGEPFHSLTGTRENVETLGRKTGLHNVPVTLPRRVGEILREPVLLGAAGGGLLAWFRLRDRAQLPAIAGVLGVAAFSLLALGGLPIITRYAFGIAAILAIFCGAGAFGWLLLERRDPWRRRWAVFGAVVLAVGVAFLPQQARRLDRTRDAIAFQQGVGDDLWTVPLPGCRGLGVVNHRLVPTLALREDADPGAIDAAPLARGFRGRYVEPASARVARGYVLDPRDPSQEVAATPPGFRPAAGNASWRVLTRCR